MSNTFNIELHANAATFTGPNPDTATRTEIARILREVADNLETGRPSVGTLFDTHGKRMGAAYWSD